MPVIVLNADVVHTVVLPIYRFLIIVKLLNKKLEKSELKMLKISTNPHMQTTRNTRSIMLDVIIALIPAIIASALFFGVDALRVIFTSVASCVLFEYLACRYWLKRQNSTTDYSAVITGILLAFNLPSTMPCWMILIGAFFAIIIAKICFGGLGKNIF